MLDDLFATLPDQSDKTHMPRLSMKEDTVAAVSNALAHICHGFVLPNQDSSARNSKLAFVLCNLPAYASYIEFCDKYDMAIVAQALLAQTMPVLRNYLYASWWEEEHPSQILDCTAVAHAYNLVPMLAMCEAIIIKHFAKFACNCEMMTSKLSKESMLNVAKGMSKLKEDMHANMVRYDARVQDIVSHCAPVPFGPPSCQEVLKTDFLTLEWLQRQQHIDVHVISTLVASMHNIPTAALGLCEANV